MAKTKPGRKDLDSYTIKGTNKVVRHNPESIFRLRPENTKFKDYITRLREYKSKKYLFFAKKLVWAYLLPGISIILWIHSAGDCVVMRAPDTGKLPYVARVENIEVDHRNNFKVRVRWYYRPEESIGGRRQFHGAKELFLSDHYDLQSAYTIDGKCIVHSFKNYTKLENVEAEDYFCRFEYKAATGGFTPDRVAVYCKCEMPYNPDDLMVQCEGCKDWFHPSCMGMTIEEAKKLDQFLCSDCSSDDDAKRPLNQFPLSSSLEKKMETKRRKR